MSYLVEIERDGTVHIPEDVLASLKLHPGAKLVLERKRETATVTMRPPGEPPRDRIYEDRGVLVYRALNADPSYDFLASIDEMREDRMRQIMGWTTQEDDDVR